VEQEGRGVSPEVEYARIFPEMDKLKGLRCAKCDRKIDLKEGLRQWPMNPVKDRFVCMDCEFELQLESGMYNK